MAHRSMQPGCARPTPCMRRRDEAWSLACAIRTTRIWWSFMFRRRAKPRPMRWRANCPITASIPGWSLPVTRQPMRPPASGRSATRRLPVNLTPQARPIKLTPRKALAEVRPAFDIERMKADVEWLAAPEREGRGAGSRGLDAAANYIAERFERLGLSPLTPGARGDDRYFQPFTMTGETGAAVAGQECDRSIARHEPGFERSGIDRIRALRSSGVWLAGCARRCQRAIAPGR